MILDDVARLSGVSRATASRALGDKPGVTDEVRARVLLVAQGLNYRPNRAAKQLAGARTSLLGLVLGATDLHHNPYSARLVDAMAKAAEELDHGLLLVMSRNEPARAVNNLIYDRIVDGVVISSVVYREPWAERLMEAPLPSVLIGRHPERTDLPTVETENLEPAAAITTHLIDTGCTRIGLIEGPPDRSDAQDRYAGFEAGHERRGRVVDEDLVVAGDFSADAGYEGAKQLIERGVDGIFALNDLSAMGVLAACDELGRRVPDDISVAGFDGSLGVQDRRHDLTTVVQPFDSIARSAIQLLLDPGPGIVAVEPEIKFGTTTRKDGGLAR